MPHSDNGLANATNTNMKTDATDAASDSLLGDSHFDLDQSDSAQLDRAIIDNISSAVLVLDNQLRILMCNLRFCNLFDLPDEMIVGQSISDVFHDDTLEVLVLQAVSTQESMREIEYTQDTPDADERQFLVSVSRLDDLPGSARALVTLDEITDWQRRQRQVMEASRLVSIGEMVAGAAHEINNPLAAVMGFSQLVLRRTLDPDVRIDVERILGEATRASKIVANLQSFARRNEPSQEPVELADLIHRILDLKAYELHLDNIEVETKLEIDSATVVGDPQQIEQVVLNLVINAAHFMKEANGGGALTIGLGQRGRTIKLSVADDGPGISPEHLPKVFDPFFTTKEVGTGTGLGLSICYGIINDHGGAITVDSKLGEGTTFTIELEAAQPSSDTVAPMPTESVEMPEQRVLIVDDEPAVVDLIKRILSDFGFSVTTASNGTEVIEGLKLEDFDIIILDYRMPEIGGAQLFEHIESISDEVAARVLFITGDAYSPTVEETVSRTGNPVLNKPFTLEDLLTAVMRVAERRAELERA
ncbi:MAG: ATP-binding protein [SAR202 cluster bacterium]|jgi:two-component system NtrC family sensor kinase|nr:ATP-binding protein [SAR202 cluster bacterium]MDP6514983.1 ATP-binding protein [SAR202 cluster bacterium]MDP6714969.1 ATP-binding protein [SAR202 cluster bacterium]